jgi:hypothetical protein
VDSQDISANAALQFCNNKCDNQVYSTSLRYARFPIDVRVTSSTLPTFAYGEDKAIRIGQSSRGKEPTERLE